MIAALLSAEANNNDIPIDEDNVRVVDFPEHLLNASFRTTSSGHV